MPSAWDSALTAVTPMRTPVKEPGPTVTASRVSCSLVTPARSSASSTMGMMFSECVILLTAAAS